MICLTWSRGMSSMAPRPRLSRKLMRGGGGGKIETTMVRAKLKSAPILRHDAAASQAELA